MLFLNKEKKTQNGQKNLKRRLLPDYFLCVCVCDRNRLQISSDLQYDLTLTWKNDLICNHSLEEWLSCWWWRCCRMSFWTLCSGDTLSSCVIICFFSPYLVHWIKRVPWLQSPSSPLWSCLLNSLISSSHPWVFLIKPWEVPALYKEITRRAGSVWLS